METWYPEQYQAFIQKWSHFCTQRKINHNQPTVEQALDFFTHLYEQGLTYSAINTARSALSSYITLEDSTSLGQHPLVSRLLRHFSEQTSLAKIFRDMGRQRSVALSSGLIACGNTETQGTDT